MGYKYLYPPTGRVYISRHVIFDETIYPFSHTYGSLHSLNTHLLQAWHKSFLLEQKSAESPTASTTEKSYATSLPLRSSVSSTFVQQETETFTEVESPSVQQSTASAETDMDSGLQHGLLIAEVEECPVRTAYQDSVPIGDSAPPPCANTYLPITNQEINSQQVSISNTHPMITRGKEGIRKPNKRYAFLSHKTSYLEPKTVKTALKDSGWNGAMNEKMENCRETNTWTLVP